MTEELLYAMPVPGPPQDPPDHDAAPDDGDTEGSDTMPPDNDGGSGSGGSSGSSGGSDSERLRE
jgi:hypothetical protein